jgi:hypothetical protein
MKVFTVLFLTHVLGDYIFQPEALAKKKESGILWVLLHTLIYACACALGLLLLGGGFIWAAALSAGSHLVIDLVKGIFFGGYLSSSKARAVFCADQILHFIAMLAAGVWVTRSFDIVTPPYMDAVRELTGMDAYKLLAYAAAGLAMMKPANVFVRVMLREGRPDNGGLDRNIRTGRCIGSLERLIMLALLALGQYGSIAIVFTAKSIARFKQLEDRAFAEYYLFGTLLSAASAVGVFIILKLFGTL